MRAGKPSPARASADSSAFELYECSVVAGVTEVNPVSKEVAALEVFRFAWFAVRTAFGLIALILVAYAALWLFVKTLSMNPGNAEPDAALRRVMSYNAPRAVQGRTVPAVGRTGTNGCDAPRAVACRR